MIQACRGGKFDYGVESEATDAPDPGAPPSEEEAKESMERQVGKGRGRGGRGREREGWRERGEGGREG